MLAGIVASGALACVGWLVSRTYGPVPKGFFVRSLLASISAWAVAVPLLVALLHRGVRQQRGARTFLGRVAGGRTLLNVARLMAGVVLTVHVAVFSGAALAAWAAWGGAEAILLLLFGAATAAPSTLATWVRAHRAAVGALSSLGTLRSEDVADLRARLPFELAAWSGLALAPLLPVTAMMRRLSATPFSPVLLALGLVAPVVAWLFHRHGRAVLRDLDRARARVGRIRDGTTIVPREGQRLEVETQEGERVVEAITTLVTTHDRLCEEELDARFSIAEAQRLKTRFMAYMSHDLRSPLNAILGFSDMLMAGGEPLNLEQRESLQIVRHAADDLLRLVAEVLDSARLEAGKLKFVSAYVSVATLLSAAVGSARRNADALGVEVETSVEPGVPAVYVDAARMQQALVGLILHLAHASPHGSAIAIRVSRAVGPPGPSAQVRVFVDAPGMTVPADPEQLFQAFRVGRRPSGMHMGGLGLGLSLARALVEAQGGAIWFEAPYTVCVALPREGH